MNSTIDGIDYGPLARLLGTWTGDQGLDVAPEPDGVARSPYHEILEFVAAGEVTNAERQRLAAVRYHQVVRRNSTGEVFHDQVGYWLREAESGRLIQTLTIPRGVAVVAEGSAEVDGDLARLAVAASLDNGIAQSQFMLGNARTLAFEHLIEVTGDELRYRETTLMDIYGERRFEHTDGNVLSRDGGG